MKEQYKRMVDMGDLEGVRISLSNEMMLDPRGDSFNEMRAYAEASISDLYEQHDGKDLDENQDNWNQELLFSTKNTLDDNFSKERLDYYYRIAQVVLRDKAKRLDNDSKMTDFRSSRSSQSPNSSQSGDPSKALLTVVAAGSLLVGGTGLIIGRAAIAAVGLAVAAVSGTYLYKNKQK